MAKCVFIVQGEGRGHMSQSIALKEYIETAGHTVELVFAGTGSGIAPPAYFLAEFKGKLQTFRSPYFLRTPNRKGIYVARTLIFNLAFSFIYFREIRRIREKINALEPDVVFNFYDVVGALALKKIKQGIRRIGIGHHFFLHLDGYRCEGGSGFSKALLKLHTRIILQSCDRALALSFREEKGSHETSVVPPLIRSSFRGIKYQPGDRYLVYLLHEGYLYNLMQIATEDPDFKADVFTVLEPDIKLPAGISLHPPDQDKFREKMTRCRGLICSAGFDTVAEAAYLGIPVLVVPSQHHFEQRCNSADVERSGIGAAVKQLVPGIQELFSPFDNREYRNWVDRAGGLILKSMEE